MIAALIQIYGDLTFVDDVEQLRLVALRDDLLVDDVHPWLHQHGKVHDLVLGRLMKYLELAYAFVVNEFDDFVFHQRIHDLKELVHLRPRFTPILQLAHVRKHGDLHFWLDIVQLERKVNEVKQVLVHLLGVLRSLNLCRNATGNDRHQDSTSQKHHRAQLNFISGLRNDVVAGYQQDDIVVQSNVLHCRTHVVKVRLAVIQLVLRYPKLEAELETNEIITILLAVIQQARLLLIIAYDSDVVVACDKVNEQNHREYQLYDSDSRLRLRAEAHEVYYVL